MTTHIVTAMGIFVTIMSFNDGTYILITYINDGIFFPSLILLTTEALMKGDDGVFPIVKTL